MYSFSCQALSLLLQQILELSTMKSFKWSVLFFLSVGSIGPSSPSIAHAAPLRPQQAARLPGNDNPPARNLSPEISNPRFAVVESRSRGHGSPLFLNAIVLVASVNLVLNILRPDPSIIWQVRTCVDCRSGQYYMLCYCCFLFAVLKVVGTSSFFENPVLFGSFGFLGYSGRCAS